MGSFCSILPWPSLLIPQVITSFGAADMERAGAQGVQQLLKKRNSVCLNPVYLSVCNASEQDAMQAAGLLQNNELPRHQVTLHLLDQPFCLAAITAVRTCMPSCCMMLCHASRAGTLDVPMHVMLRLVTCASESESDHSVQLLDRDSQCQDNSCLCIDMTGNTCCRAWFDHITTCWV